MKAYQYFKFQFIGFALLSLVSKSEALQLVFGVTAIYYFVAHFACVIKDK